MSDRADKLAQEMAEALKERWEIGRVGPSWEAAPVGEVAETLRPHISALEEAQCRDEEEHEILRGQLADSEKESKIHVWEQLAEKYLRRAEEAEAKLADAFAHSAGLQESILRARDLRDEEWNGAFHQLRLALNEAGYGGPLTTDAIASIAREIPQMVKLQEQIQAQEKLICQLRTDIGAHLQEIDRLSSRYSRSNTSRNPGESQ